MKNSFWIRAGAGLYLFLVETVYAANYIQVPGSAGAQDAQAWFSSKGTMILAVLGTIVGVAGVGGYLWAATLFMAGNKQVAKERAIHTSVGLAIAALATTIVYSIVTD